MHIALPIGQGTVLMGSDVPEAYKVTTGTNFLISINADSKEEADKLFNGLAAGGQVTMPMGKTFWGSYFGMFKDKYDIQWMVSYNENQS
jgi:PhnB protein